VGVRLPIFAFFVPAATPENNFGSHIKMDKGRISFTSSFYSLQPEISCSLAGLGCRSGSKVLVGGACWLQMKSKKLKDLLHEYRIVSI
jgi:hypothetical protein